jgi:hypothetical protein
VASSAFHFQYIFLIRKIALAKEFAACFAMIFLKVHESIVLSIANTAR